jgi:16S rRNA (cytosine1402-N4)-methyltransferase
MNKFSPLAANSHVPVLLHEVMQYMQPQDGEIYIDGTFGAGGYSRALLEISKAKLYAIDQDPDVSELADKVALDYPNRFHFTLGNFSEMDELMKEQGVKEVDGVMLDFGVSSMQLETAERGFSFDLNARLDMRMSKEGKDAFDVVNGVEEEELANIIYQFGGEHKSRRVAKAIVRAREKQTITTTSELANIVRSVVGYHKGHIDPATRTFQALRIFVNDELTALSTALIAAERILKVGGKLVVVSFHSLEDAIVKDFFNDRTGKAKGVSRHFPVMQSNDQLPSFALLSKGVVKPSEQEVKQNPRSRSARLRAAKKIRAAT